MKEDHQGLKYKKRGTAGLTEAHKAEKKLTTAMADSKRSSEEQEQVPLRLTRSMVFKDLVRFRIAVVLWT